MHIHLRLLYMISAGEIPGGCIGGFSFVNDEEDRVIWLAIGMVAIAVIIMKNEGWTLQGAVLTFEFIPCNYPCKPYFISLQVSMKTVSLPGNCRFLWNCFYETRNPGFIKSERWEYLGQQQGQKQVYLAANITGPKSADLAFYPLKGLNFGRALSADSSVGTMSVTAQALPHSSNKFIRRAIGRFLGKRVGAPPATMPLFEKGPVQYKIGQLTWDTGEEHDFSRVQCWQIWQWGCSWRFSGSLEWSWSLYLARKLLTPVWLSYVLTVLVHQNRQIDCRFECTVPAI